jgi:hypothetical protein
MLKSRASEYLDLAKGVRKGMMPDREYGLCVSVYDNGLQVVTSGSL